MNDVHARRRRVAVTVAVAGAGALLVAGCWRPGPRPPVTTPTTAPSTTPTTAPSTTPTTHVDPPPPPGGGWTCGPSAGGPPTTHGHGAGGPVDTGGAHHIPPRLDHPPTPAQLEVAEKLIADTKAAAPRFADYKVAESLGYKSIGDNRSGVAHYVHLGKQQDGKIYDPANVEALVYKTNPGTGAVLGLQTFMYIMEPGCTMENVPDVAGNLVVYHAHDNLCYKKSDPGVLSGILINGRCMPESEDSHFVPSKPMVHVWIVDNPCGPFAGVDLGNRTGSCAEGH